MQKGVILMALASAPVMAQDMVVESAKVGAYLTIVALLVSLPAFVSLYLHIRRTNLGQVLRQPLLAMFIGFFGIMINGLIHIWMIFNGHQVTNMDMVMGINRAMSAILIAVGCVLLFFTVKNKGLFNMSYYRTTKKHKHK